MERKAKIKAPLLEITFKGEKNTRMVMDWELDAKKWRKLLELKDCEKYKGYLESFVLDMAVQLVEKPDAN